MNPHGVIFICELEYLFRKCLVYSFVCFPILRVHLGLSDEIMEKGPDGLVGETFVVILEILGLQRYTSASSFRQSLLDLIVFIGGEILGCDTGPSSCAGPLG